MALRDPYDRWDLRAMLLGPIYPMLFRIVSAGAAVNQQITALIRGPRKRRVVWDIPREPVTKPQDTPGSPESGRPTRTARTAGAA